MQGVDGKRVAALIGDGFEEADLLEPRRALEEAGAVVTIVGLDERARQRIRGKRGLDDGQSVRAEELVADCTAEDFDALLIPGGVSPDRIRTDREVQRFVREFDTLKKPMFSIGHGAQVLAEAWFRDRHPDLVNNRIGVGDCGRLTCLGRHRYRLPPVRIRCMFRMNSLPAPPSASRIVVPV